MIKMKALAAAAGVFVVAASLAGCGSTPEPAPSAVVDTTDLDALIEAAKAEGPLQIYGSVNDKEANEFLDGFADAYDLPRGEFQRVLSAEASQRFLAEAEAGQVTGDLIFTTTPQLYSGDNAQYFNAVDDTLVPELSPEVDSGSAGNAFVWGLSAFVITYNTDLVDPKDAPETWEDLANPEFKGSLILGDPRTSQNKANWYLQLMEENGSLLEDLVTQNPTIESDGAGSTQKIAAGAAMIGAPLTVPYATALPEGAPIATVVPEGPAYVSPLIVGMPKLAPHPATARLFLYWMQTQGGVDVICNPSYGNSLPPYIDGGSSNSCVEISDEVIEMTVDLTDAQDAEIFQTLGI